MESQTKIASSLTGYLTIFILGVFNLALAAEASAPTRYTISSTMEILKPVNLGAMTTDSQSVQVLSENSQTITVKITVDPTVSQITSLVPNANWKSEYAGNSRLAQYLKPGVTTNWDDDMRSELLAALAKAGIFPDQLSDVEVVKKVSQWIFGGSEFQFQDHFVSYDVDFVNGNAVIIPELKQHFDSQKIQNNFATEADALAGGIFGKSMFRNRKFGNCTFSATLQATILKALGIPTRLVLMVPAIDWNSQAQWNMIHDGLHQWSVRKTVLEGLSLQSIGSWGSHTFNEVYVGNKWVRLNYTNLGQTPIDSTYFGLMLQVNRMSDWSEAHLGKTWGVHAQAHNLVQLSSNNPYRTIDIHDATDVLNSSNNPPVLFPEIKIVKLEKSFNADDSSLPSKIRDNIKADASFAVIFNSNQEAPKFNYIAMFRRNVSRKFILRASGYPDVPAAEVGSWTDQGFTAFKIKPQDMSQMVSGVEYQLIPETTQGPYHWEADVKLKFVRPQANTNTAPVPQSGYFNTKATVTQAKMSVAYETGCPSGKICIVFSLAEAIDFHDLSPINQFYGGMTMNFVIQSAGSDEVPLVFYGITAVNQGQNVGFVFSLDPSAMLSGVTYQVLYKGAMTQGPYQWVFPASLTVSR